ncbi:hypothetical protein [Micromonospora carbonacea]|uniref:hypothetical protein n=1 Tax=Micromonospora carbonacea TaxID=47853 RepID=UPI00371B762B
MTDWIIYGGLVLAALLAVAAVAIWAHNFATVWGDIRSQPDRRAAARDREHREAEQRWHAINAAARAAGCLCGQPATHVARMPTGFGNCVHEVWTCAEHVGVNEWASNGDGTASPRFDRTSPCADCVGRCSTQGRIGADRPDTWMCPTRPEAADAAPPYGGALVSFQRVNGGVE